MNWKVAIAVIAVIGIALFVVATVSAHVINTSNVANSASSGSNYRGYYGFDDDGRDDWRQGRMMGPWGPFSRNSNQTWGERYFDDDWGWHE